MRRFVSLLALVGLSACNATSNAPSPRASILRHDPATVHASTKPTTQRAEWNVFEYRTFLDGRGGRMPFRMLYPVNYDRNKPGGYPMVLFLHGAGERGSDNERQLVHGSKMFINPENREKFPAIVVLPQCPPTPRPGAPTRLRLVRRATCSRPGVPPDPGHDGNSRHRRIRDTQASG